MKDEQAWPGPESFLRELGPHATIADVGCGNGKYLALAQRLGVRMVGCDVCVPLVHIAAERGCECFVCDGLRTPFRDGAVVCCTPLPPMKAQRLAGQDKVAQE